MSIYCNITEQDLINLREPAEQQKAQRTLKLENRVLKRTRDINLAENFPPITKKLDVTNESPKNLGEIVKKLDVEDGDTQTPAIENITSTQSLRDRLVLMKIIKILFIQEKKKEMYVGTMYLFNHLERIELVLKITNSI